MPLDPGTRLGPYEVLAPLSAGAESDERYKATDSRANRLVSLRVLPPEFAEHPEMRQRLERDARTISSLNHPNICALVEVAGSNPVSRSILPSHTHKRSTCSSPPRLRVCE